MIYKLFNRGNGFEISTDADASAEKLLVNVKTANDKVTIDYCINDVKLKTLKILPNGIFKEKKMQVGIIAFPYGLELFFCDKAGFLNPNSEHLIHPTDFFTIEIEQNEN